MTDAAGYLNRVKDEIGPLTPTQDLEVLAAIETNSEGVLALAHRVACNPAAQSKPAVFLSSLRRGDHHAAGGRAKPAPQTKLEKAHALFTGKYRALPPSMDTRARRMIAVDYALQECGAWGADLLAIEIQLRLELDAIRRDDDPDWERETTHRRLMRERHRA